MLPRQHWRRHHQRWCYPSLQDFFSHHLCTQRLERERPECCPSWEVTDKSQQGWQQAGKRAVWLLSCSCSPLAWFTWAHSAPMACGIVQDDTPSDTSQLGVKQQRSPRDTCVVFCCALTDLILLIPEVWGRCTHVSYWILSHGKGCVSYQGGNHWCQVKLLISSFLMNAQASHPGKFALEGDGRFRTEYNPCYQKVIMRANTCLYSFWAGCWAGNTTVQDCPENTENCRISSHLSLKAVELRGAPSALQMCSFLSQTKMQIVFLIDINKQ